MQNIISVIRTGGVVVFPTETVYGMGCDSTNELAIQKIYDLKVRENKPLSIMVADVEMAQKYANFSPQELVLAQKYWPAALTMVVKKRACVLPEAVTLGSPYIGIRIPDYAPLLDVLKQLKTPLIATSVNKSGTPDILTGNAIRSAFPTGIDYFWDDDAAITGRASTVIQVLDDQIKILRQGAVIIQSF